MRALVQRVQSARVTVGPDTSGEIGRGFCVLLGVAGTDTDDDARRLAALLTDLPAHVNLIPHNAFDASPLRAPADERVFAFQARLREAGLRALIRWPRGREVAAACGQLARKR